VTNDASLSREFEDLFNFDFAYLVQKRECALNDADSALPLPLLKCADSSEKINSSKFRPIWGTKVGTTLVAIRLPWQEIRRARVATGSDYKINVRECIVVVEKLREHIFIDFIGADSVVFHPRCQ
jgi:hypothetical protein